MKIIDNELLVKVSVEASSNSRRRKNFNFHENYSDPINRMLNAFEPGTYVQPHRHAHPDKREVFIILTGRVGLFVFDDHGEVKQLFVLDRDAGLHGVEVPPGTWHTVISLEPGSVVYEVKDGPYQPLDDKDFAKWAPPEGSEQSAVYLQGLERIATTRVG